jgi:hypothetical protein
MSDNNTPTRKSTFITDIPAAVWIALGIQLLGGIIWSVRLDSRVGYVENKNMEQSIQIDRHETRLETNSLRQVTFEERFTGLSDRVSSLQRQIDALVHSPPPPRP